MSMLICVGRVEVRYRSGTPTAAGVRAFGPACGALAGELHGADAAVGVEVADVAAAVAARALRTAGPHRLDEDPLHGVLVVVRDDEEGEAHDLHVARVAVDPFVDDRD